MVYCRDMDDWSLTLLSCKVSLIGKSTGEQVIKKGDPGNCAYIILTGAVKVCMYVCHCIYIVYIRMAIKYGL